jgi:glycosyltransferase involved in cell wall biosynthesis
LKPRVLRIITRLNVGGPATHVTLADRGLAERGWETLLVHGTVEPDEAEVDLETLDIPSRRVRTLARPVDPTRDARALVELLALIRGYRPHIIHTHLSKAGLIGRLAAMTASPAPRIHTFHGTVFGGYFGERTSGSIVRIERFLGHHTAAVLALSERQRDELLGYSIAPPERFRIVPLGLDLARFTGQDRAEARVRLGIADEALLVVVVGRLVPIKRLDRVIRAFVGVRGAVPPARLVFVGDGAERAALEALTASLDLGAAIRFVGWSADSAVWYAAADIAALTSEREGTPLALIEAAASGRPVVAVDVGGVRDVVADGETGFIVPPDDLAALTDRLIQLALDPGLRDRMGRLAPARATMFDHRRLVSDLDGLYRELLGSHRP